MKGSRIIRLTNGYELLYVQSRSKISFLGAVVKVGSRNESKAQHGMAHFLEHLLFKGTKKYSASQIIEQTEGNGIELNAYTTKEDTSIYMVSAQPNLKKQIRLLTQILFESNFPEKEIKKERAVIYDEINYYEDQPSEMIFEEFEQKLLPNSALGRPILGTKKSLKKFTQKQLKGFHEKYNQKGNMLLVCCTPICEQQVTRQFNKALKNYTPFKKEKPKALAIQQPSVFSLKRTKKLHQSHIVMGKLIFGYKDARNWPMVLLNHYFGGNAMSSLLNMHIREYKALSYQVESNYQPFHDCGLFTIYASFDAAKQKKIEQQVKKCCKILQKGLDDKAFKKLKKQVKAQFLFSLENQANNLLSTAKSYLMLGKLHQDKEILKRIDQIDLKTTNALAKEVFAFDSLSKLTYIAPTST